MERRMEKSPLPFLSWLESEPSRKWKRIGLTGLAGSAKAYLLSHLRKKVKGPLLIIVPHLRDAQSLLEDIQFFQRETDSIPFLFPQWETLPYDEIPPHPEITRERVRCLFSLLRNEEMMIISSIQGVDAEGASSA